ncbi:MAG: TlyA family RNA methyltransferase [Chloroflexota bacterium]
MKKIRVDILLVQRGLIDSQSKAQRLVMAGQVRVNGEIVLKPSVAVSKNASIEIKPSPEYVSRGGKKLIAALYEFNVQVEGLVCADVGASTGGFTDCLLQHGATRVYAIDVGYGILHWKLRNDERVVVLERTNARYLESLPEPVSLVTVDASFISLNYLLPMIKNWFKDQSGRVIALIKPQFEARREQARIGGGVIWDEAVHIEVLERVLQEAGRMGYVLKGLIASPLRGPKGNIEFLADLRINCEAGIINLEAVISGAIGGASG